jgi:hypothetical protein
VELSIVGPNGLLLIRYPAKDKGDRHLDEQTNGRESVAGQTWKTEAFDDGRAVSIKPTERPVVEQRDGNMNPE